MANGLKVERYPMERIRDFVNVGLFNIKEVYITVGSKNLVVSYGKYFYYIKDGDLEGLWLNLINSRAYVNAFSLEKIVREEIKGLDFKSFYEHGIPFHPEKIFSREYGLELFGTLDIEDIIETIFIYSNLLGRLPVANHLEIVPIVEKRDKMSKSVWDLYKAKGAYYLRRFVAQFREFELSYLYSLSLIYGKDIAAMRSLFLSKILNAFKNGQKELLLLSGNAQGDFSVSGQLVDLDNSGILGFARLYLLLKDKINISFDHKIEISEDNIERYLLNFSKHFRRFLGRDPEGYEVSYLKKEMFFLKEGTYQVKIIGKTGTKIGNSFLMNVVLLFQRCIL